MDVIVTDLHNGIAPFVIECTTDDCRRRALDYDGHFLKPSPHAVYVLEVLVRGNRTRGECTEKTVTRGSLYAPNLTCE